MKIENKRNKKNTKYNRTVPIKLEKIPTSELLEALKEFSEGSIGMEECLKEMWINNLVTHACCIGHDDFDLAYIAMRENIDLFKYISEELLENDNISIEISYGRQVIRFFGTKEEKEILFFKLAEDIKTGIKNNKHIIDNKIGKTLDSKILAMYKNKSTEELIDERWKEINYILDNGTQEEIDAIWDEYVEKVEQINMKLLSKRSGY